MSPWIAPSILAADFAALGEEVRNVVAAGADSLVIVGLTTSGCVRATAVDGLQHDYQVVVPREAVGDRNAAAHEANLFDLDAKYADVVSVGELFDLITKPTHSPP